MATHYLKYGDTAKKIEAQLLDDGAPVDLTDVDQIVLLLRREGASASFQKVGEESSGGTLTGLVEYQPLSADYAVNDAAFYRGSYRLEWRLRRTDLGPSPAYVTYPTKGYDKVVIVGSLA